MLTCTVVLYRYILYILSGSASLKELKDSQSPCWASEIYRDLRLYRLPHKAQNFGVASDTLDSTMQGMPWWCLSWSIHSWACQESGLAFLLGFVCAMLAGFLLRGSVATRSQPFCIHLLEQVDGWPCGYDIAFAA